MEYDGSRFLGWQTQSAGGTVQDAVEAALGGVAVSAVTLTAAGRTDTGVHATLQVAHFDTDAARPDTAWVRGANSLLPEAVAVLWARPVDGEFHARFSARSRTYRYRLLNRPVRPALGARQIGWFHHPLDVARMREAAAMLVGEHDFSAFRSSECQAKSPVRTIQEFRVEQPAQGRVDFVVRANAFLHHMVRNLVGALVYVGKGNLAPPQFKELLGAKDRTKAPPTFGPEGLYLEHIEYEAKWGLPQ